MEIGPLSGLTSSLPFIPQLKDYFKRGKGFGASRGGQGAAVVIVKGIFLLTLLSLGMSLESYGQSLSEEGIVASKRSGGMSPTAASLGKFGDIPVSTYTGTPDISIPLTEANGHHLSLPITLRYHASGVKVDKIAGWVGLGWSLDAGGVITRTVRGRPDEDDRGYLATRDSLKAYMDGRMEGKDIIEDVINKQVDPKPDRFFFNFAGQSGEFYLRDRNRYEEGEYLTNGGAKTVNYQNLRIRWESEGERITKFVVTTKEGTQYVFGGTSSAIEVGYDKHGTTPSPRYRSSWYLSEVRSPRGEVIELNYQRPTPGVEHKRRPLYGLSLRRYQCSISDQYGNPIRAITNETHTSQPTYVLEKYPYLTSIQTEKRRIEFESSTNREDPGRRKLETIRVYQEGQELKYFSFGYTYMNGEGDAKEKRLMLQTVQEKGSSNNPPPYRFSYYTRYTLPPPFESNAVDKWGYYNGKTSNTSRMPINGADRSPSFPQMKAGTLTKIKYPTGGTTTFEYGPHTYSKRTNDGTRTQSTPTVSVQDTAKIGDIDEDNCSSASCSEKKTFQVPFSQEVSFDWSMACHPYKTMGHCEGNSVFYIDEEQKWPADYDKDSEGVIYHQDEDPNGEDDTFSLWEGQEYSMKASITGYGYSHSWVAVTYEKEASEVEGEIENPIAGGLRIKRIVSDPKEGPEKIERYKYPDPEAPSASSGVLVDRPVYRMPEGEGRLYTDFTRTDDGWIGEACSVKFGESVSTLPLGLSKGGAVVYRHVVKEEGGSDSGNGSTHYRYLSPVDTTSDGTLLHDVPERGAQGVLGVDRLPVHMVSRKWMRGQLKKEWHTNSDHERIREARHQYDLVGSRAHDEIGNPDFPTIEVKKFSLESGVTTYIVVAYNVRTGWSYKTQTKTIHYDNQGRSLSNTIDYNYVTEGGAGADAFAQLRSKTESTSNGESRTTRIEYAHENHVSNMGADGTHQLSQKYRTTVFEDASGDGELDSDELVFRRSWTEWMRNRHGKMVPASEWVWTPDSDQ